MKFKLIILVPVCCSMLFMLLLLACTKDDPAVDETFAEAERINNNSNLGLVYLEPSSVPSEEAEKGTGTGDTLKTDTLFVL